MENISNKAQSLAKFGLKLEVTKSKDILGKDSVKAKDVLHGGNDVKINKMSDIFPQSNQNIDDILS